MYSFKISKKEYEELIYEFNDWPSYSGVDYEIVYMGEDFFGEGRVTVPIVFRKDSKYFKCYLYAKDGEDGMLTSDKIMDYDDLNVFFPIGLTADEAKYCRVTVTEDKWINIEREDLHNFDSYVELEYKV